MNDVKRYAFDQTGCPEECNDGLYVAYEDYEKLMELGSVLAAGQCDGVVGDDYGHSYCNYKKERDELRRRLDLANSLLTTVMDEGDIDHVLGQTLVENITEWLKESK